VTDGIKSLGKIQGNDNNIGVDSKERGDSMKDGNKGSSGGASRTKSKLFMKGKCGWGSEKAGYMYLRTIIFSNILVRTGVMEIGLKSACVVGAAIFGTG